MMRVIVNADDFGMDRNRTEAIRECFRNGFLTTTTLMVNMPYNEQAVVDARSDGFADNVGLHLNLTQGVPLTENIRQCPNFCSRDGVFSGAFHRSKLSRFMLSSMEQKAVAEEIRAQMAVFCKYELPMKHLDSHHHAHTDPSILSIVLPLAKEYGFRSVRMSRNLPAGGGVLKRMYKWIVNNRIERSGFVHTDYFGAVEAVVKAVELLDEDCCVEIMTHPLYSQGTEMNLNCLYDSTNGDLCDSRRNMRDIMLLCEPLFAHAAKITYGALP